MIECESRGELGGHLATAQQVDDGGNDHGLQVGVIDVTIFSGFRTVLHQRSLLDELLVEPVERVVNVNLLVRNQGLEVVTLEVHGGLNEHGSENAYLVVGYVQLHSFQNLEDHSQASNKQLDRVEVVGVNKLLVHLYYPLVTHRRTVALEDVTKPFGHLHKVKRAMIQLLYQQVYVHDFVDLLTVLCG